MDRITAVLSIMLPIILLMGFGMLSNKKGWVSARGVDEMKGIMTRICIPALVFNTFYSASFTSSAGMIVLCMAIFTVLQLALGFGLQKVFRIKQEFFPFLCCTMEGGMLGFALYILLFGEENLYHIGFVDLGTALIMFPFLLTILRLRGKGELGPKMIVENVATPINIAIAAGLILNLTGLSQVIISSAAGTVLNETLTFVTKPTSAMILICVGHGLDFSKVQWAETAKTILIRMAIYLAVGFVMWKLVTVKFFPGDVMFEYAVILGFVLPPTFMYSACTKGDEEEAYVGSVLAVYTIITLIAFGFIVWNVAGLV